GVPSGTNDPQEIRSMGQDQTEIEQFIAERRAGNIIRGPGLRPGQLPNGTGWYDRFNIEQQLENDYLIDREAQRSGKSFSGIPGVRQQDMAVTDSMGPIYKRYNEHLGTTDAMIIRTRRRLIAAAKAL